MNNIIEDSVLNSACANDLNTTDDNGGYKYRFSVVMSVYNVEEFLDEAVESLINQSIGFENIQLIMVDDGSADTSGEICDKYKEMYPDNVVVIHKENGGLSDARNTGLKYVEGRYISFFDPDDILSETTFNKVYKLFIANDNKIDVVSIPLIYFGDRNGPHHLNGKFAKGTRIINLQKEYEHIQLSLASSFIKNDIAKSMHFSSELVIAEDAEQLLKIFSKKPFLGVVHNCRYSYRRREGSQVTSANQKKGFYTEYVRHFSLRSLLRAKDEFGYVPKFIQNAVMCDLQWRLIEQEVPAMLSEEELKEYYDLIDQTVALLDDDIIMLQKHLVLDAKVYLLSRKYGSEKYIQTTTDNIYYGYDNAINHRFSSNTVQLHSVAVKEDTVKICLRQVYLGASGDIEKMYVSINGNTVDAENIKTSVNKKCSGVPVSYYYMADFTLPRTLLTKKDNQIAFHTVCRGADITNRNIKSGRFFPVETRYKNGYFYDKGIIIKKSNNAFVIKNATKSDVKKAERALKRELWKSNKLGEKKAVIVRTLARFYKLFHRKPVWIITDRLNKAGDNGEAFFRHLKETKFDKAEYFYVITKCPDYDKLKKLGNVVDHNSMKYKLLHLICDVIISSHADEFVINPFKNYYYPYKDILVSKRYVFLQHGVTKDDISGWLRKYNKNMQGFVCAAIPEAKSLLEYDYYYSEDEVWLTGFARFDRLYNDEKKFITLMPTWRRYLMKSYDTQTGVWCPVDNFTESEYFKFYNSLLNDERLLSVCESRGYKLSFMPHPNLIPHISLFNRDSRVKFFTIDDEYRDVYAKSNLLLTDYSSAVFDFAYMRKPLLYTHFDKTEFFGGSHVYVEGYFDYDEDGFGEVCYDYETTVKTLIEYVENDCALKPEYRERIDGFFAFNDKNNSARIVDKILEMEAKK